MSSNEQTHPRITVVGRYGMSLQTAGDLVAIADGTMFGISEKKPGGADASNNNILIKDRFVCFNYSRAICVVVRCLIIRIRFQLR